MNKILLLLKNITAITLSLALIINPISPAWAMEDNSGLEKQRKSSTAKKPLTFDRIINLSKRAKKGDPNANYKLGKIFYKERNYTKAIKYFEKAKSPESPEYPKANKYLAKIKKQIEPDPKSEGAGGRNLKEERRPFEEVLDTITERTVNEVYSEGLPNVTPSDVPSSSRASLSQPTMTNEERKTLEDISYLKKAMEEVEEKFPACVRSSTPLTFLVGNTGSGKTSLGRLLNDETLFGIQDPHNDNAFIFEDTDEISGGITSKTTEPRLVADTYVDCPGFNDTRGTLQEIRNALYIQRFLRNHKSIKFCLLMPASDFKMENTRGKNVIEALEKLQKMVRDPNKLENGVSLIVTHHNKVSDPTLGNIRSILEELATHRTYEKQKNLLQALYKHENRIAFFSAPSRLGEYQNNTEKDILLKTTQNTSPSLLDAKDVCVSLSPSAQLRFNTMFDHLTKYMTTLLTKEVAEKINYHYGEKISGFKRLIDGLVEKGMQCYTPTAFIKWAAGGGVVVGGGGAAVGTAAVTGAVGTTIPGAVTIVGTGTTTITAIAGTIASATATGGITTTTTAGITTIIGTGATTVTAAGGGLTAGLTSATATGGITATATTFTTGMGVAAVAIPVVIVGIIGGIGGGILYKIKKNSCRKKITDEFKTREVEEIKLNLRYCARKLRKMRYGIKDNFLKKAVFLSTPALSEIKTTFDSLSCLSQITGDHDGTYFAQVIWQPTFSRLENTLRYYAHESGKFYEEGIPKPLKALPNPKFLAQDLEEEFRVLMEKVKENNKLSHISEDFIKTLLTNYLEEPDTDQNFSLTGSHLPQKKLERFIDYMTFCQHIYTDDTTRGFVTRDMVPTMRKKWGEIIWNKNEIDRLYNNLLVVQQQWDGISKQPSTYERTGAKTKRSKQVPALSRKKLRPNHQENYTNCIQEINSFLQETLNRRPINHEEIGKIGSAVRELKEAQEEINREFSWHFGNKPIDASIPSFTDNTDGTEYPLTSKAVVAASFLHKTQLLNNPNVSILDVGFRNLQDLEGIYTNFMEHAMAFKRNSQAFFLEQGEVDYIAYIEKDTTSKARDKLVIVYSGSNSSKDWAANLTIGRKAGIGDLSVHEGIGRLFAKSAPNYGNLLVDKISDYYSNNRKPRNFKVHTAGHSLGGALALLDAYHYKTIQTKQLGNILGIGEDKMSVKTFMFGAPAIVDEPSKRSIEKALGKKNIFRVSSYHDPVALLSTALYFHVGRSFLLHNIANNIYNFGDELFWGHHEAERYLCYLRALKEEHLSESHKELTSILKKHTKMIRILKKTDGRLYEKVQSNLKGNYEEKQKEKKKEKRGRNTTSSNTVPPSSEPDGLEGYDYSNLYIPLMAEENINKLPVQNRPCNPVGQLSKKTYSIDGRNFRLQDVSGDNMRCFFNAAGLDPGVQINLLKKNRNNPVVRYMIANEIVSAAANPNQLPRQVKWAIDFKSYWNIRQALDSLDEARNTWIRSQFPEEEDPPLDNLPEDYRNLRQRGAAILEELRGRALHLKAFNAFLDHHIRAGDMMVSLHDVRENGQENYTSIDAIAYVNNMGVKIYSRNNESALNLTHNFIPEGAIKVVYIYHEGIHFQALIPEYEEKGSSSSKTKVAHNLPGDHFELDELGVIKAQFLTGELPEEMREENYDRLRNKFETTRSNVDALVSLLNGHFFPKGGRKNPEDLKKYLASLVENNSGNKDYQLQLKNLSNSLEKESRLSQKIEQYCQRQLKGKAKN